jgi:phosphoribosylanthranilate isomerase
MLFSFALQVSYFNKMLKTKIKASAVNNLTDARYFAAREVEWLGFRFGGGIASSLSPLAVRAIIEWVDGVKIVGEFDFAAAEEIKEANEMLHFDAVQVGMFTPVAELEKLPELSIIKEVVIGPTSSESEVRAHLQAYAHCCAHFLLDFTKSSINWEMIKAGSSLSIPYLQELFAENKVILALDFQPEETLQVLETLLPAGLSLTGGEEEKIGLKSFEELDEILDRLEILV